MDTVSTTSHIDWSPLISAAVALVAAGLGLLASWLRGRGKVEDAKWRVAELVAVASQKAWDDFSPTMQRILADGKVTADERREIEAVLPGILRAVVSDQVLEETAKALRVPLPGLMAMIASRLIDAWATAHDANPYPVAVASDSG